MENPIIDEGKLDKFGERDIEQILKREIEFLVSHFKENVPGEWEFMLEIANMIRSGVNNAIPMNQELIAKKRLG